MEDRKSIQKGIQMKVQKSIEQGKLLFTNQDLKKLLIPLIIEQLLVMAVGMIDVMMISFVGEDAVAGVSLVDTVNVLIINMLTAFATGGAVVAGHYLGEKKHIKACQAGWQLVYFCILSSAVIMLLFIGLRNWILGTVFGSITETVRYNADEYLVITALSIIPLAIYNAAGALFRAMGNSKITMWVSLLMNVINVIGNAIFIYICRWGVGGAAFATTISRFVAAGILLALLFRKDGVISLFGQVNWKLDFHIIKKILYIGVPNGLENSFFQLGKILLLSLTATFGTVSVTANAVCNTIAAFNVLPCQAVNYATVSVISVCIGARDYEQAKLNMKKLMKIAYLSVIIFSVAIIGLAKYIVIPYNLSPETAKLTIQVFSYHALMAVFLWIPSFTMPNFLRSANDVMFAMVVAIASMWIFRIALAYVFSYYFHLGLLGIWIAMTVDWAFRAACYMIRYWSGAWKKRLMAG